MKVLIENFLGIHSKAIEIDNVTLVAGYNGSGKSSVIEAMRYAFTLDCERKGSRTNRDLINRNGKDFSISVHGDDYKGIISRESKTPLAELNPELVKISMDGSVYNRADVKARKSLVSRLFKIDVSIDKVCAEMIKAGIDVAVTDELKPFMRGGIENAQKKANDISNNFKSEWAGITGEKFGRLKSKDWKATPTKVNLLELQDKIITGDVDSLEDKKHALKAEIDGYEKTIAEYRSKTQHTSAAHEPCPSCGTLLTRTEGKLTEAEPDDTGKKTVNYASKIKKVEQSKQAAQMDFDAISRDLSQHYNAKATLDGAEAQAEAEADTLTKRAADKFDAAMKYEKAADELKPDKIPALFAGKLPSALNKEIAKHCSDAGFETMTADADLELSVNGIRYGLLSESQKWRADAVVAATFASVSGLNFLTLDRLDVLNMRDRGGVLRWLISLEFPVLVAATLKSKPEKLPKQIICEWLSDDEDKAEAA